MHLPIILPRRRNARPLLRKAIATAATGLMYAFPAVVAHGQPFYSVGGAFGSYPGNAFSGFDPNVAVFDATGNTLSIGAGAAGSFSMLAGAHLIADGLNYGDGGLGNGTGTIAGASTLAQFVGAGNRLQVGNWGSGNLVVSAGAVLDGTVNASICLTSGAACNSFIGNSAGSNGSLLITGIGSEVRLLRNFTVAQASVFTVAGSGFDFGTPGGATTASVDVTAGGALRTERATVGANNHSPNGLGTETASGTVTVSGLGSLWELTHNSIDAANNVAGLTIGFNAGGTGHVTVESGGTLRVVGNSTSDTPTTFMNIGVNGGKGFLTLTGTNSKLEMVGPAVAGAGSVIQAGRTGAGSEGTFSVLDGATAAATFLNVGRDGAKGTVVVDGAGSLVTLSGLGTWASGQIGGSAATIGWNGGNGKLTISNGGRLRVSDGGVNTSTSAGSMAINLGYIAGNGQMFIDGSGSSVEILSTSIAPTPGAPDNFNPFMAVGRDSGGTGELMITNGGKLLLNGNALSTPSFGRGTNLQIGGYSDTVLSGSGTATISGTGSQIRLEGADTFVAVGRNGNGTLNLDTQALLHIGNGGMNVGRAASGVGALSADRSTIEISGQYTNDPTIGAFLSIGNRGGNGTANLGNGSLVTLTNLGSAGASLNLGGTATNPLGQGHLTLSGGSQILISAAAGLATFSVGRDGAGTAAVTSGSHVDIGDGFTYVGRLASGVGTLTIDSGSSFLAGVISIGGGSDTVAGGTGTLGVSGAGSLLSAKQGSTQFVGVGRVAGNGTLAVSDQAAVVGTLMAVGRGTGSTGALNVDHASVELSGQQATFGAGLAIGQFGGTGTVNLSSGSTLTLTNPSGNLGVDLKVGGSSSGPLGTGTLAVTGGSQVKLVANAGPARATIGHDGIGTATFSGGSRFDVGSGQVIIAGQPGSTGTLTLNSGSTLAADYVGVGSLPGGIDGGNGSLFVNGASEVFASTLEIGTYSLAGGSGGTLHAHDLIVRGLISPGNSPGRLKIDLVGSTSNPGRLKIESTGRLKIEIGVDPSGNYSYDELVLSAGGTYDLRTLNIEFDFLGNTDPNTFAATGLFDLDTFIRSSDASGNVTGLSSTFAPGTDWTTVLSQATVTATSSSYTVSISLDNTGNGTFDLQAQPVPEPGNWALWLAGVAGVGMSVRRRRRRQGSGRGAQARS